MENLELAKEEKVNDSEVVENKPSEKPKLTRRLKIKKTIEWVVTGIFAVLILVLATFNIARWTNKDGYVFNYLFPQVLSDSMAPTYNVGEVIVVKKTEPSLLKVGDDVTFYYYFPDICKPGEEVMVTHRIVELDYDQSKPTGEQYTFVAQGVNTESPKWKDQKQTFHENKLLGKVVGKSAFMQAFYKIMSSPWTLVLLILIPSLYLIISALIDLFKKIPDEDSNPKLALLTSEFEIEVSKINEVKDNRIKEINDQLEKGEITKEAAKAEIKAATEGAKLLIKDEKKDYEKKYEVISGEIMREEKARKKAKKEGTVIENNSGEESKKIDSLSDEEKERLKKELLEEMLKERKEGKK